MSERYIYATELAWGGDVPTAELEVVVAYSVHWGTPESGRWGPPENYDPGSPAEIEDIRVLEVGGQCYDRIEPETIRAIIEKLELDDYHIEAMIDQATEENAARWADAADDRRKARREALPSPAQRVDGGGES